MRWVMFEGSQSWQEATRVKYKKQKEPFPDTLKKQEVTYTHALQPLQDPCSQHDHLLSTPRAGRASTSLHGFNCW